MQQSIQLFFVLWVALRKESVDRNCSFGLFGADKVSSLSARRAWIEIVFRGWTLNINGVALRKESVDRNGCDAPKSRQTLWSLSARRAWIEIAQGRRVPGRPLRVALRKESVDRNFCAF